MDDIDDILKNLEGGEFQLNNGKIIAQVLIHMSHTRFYLLRILQDQLEIIERLKGTTNIQETLEDRYSKIQDELFEKIQKDYMDLIRSLMQ